MCQLSSLSSQVDVFVAEVRERWEVPGVAVAVVRRDGPIHVNAYGVGSVTNSAPANVDTVFAIGSCSKAFTSGLAAALVDAGKIDWDDHNPEVSAVIPVVRSLDQRPRDVPGCIGQSDGVIARKRRRIWLRPEPSKAVAPGPTHPADRRLSRSVHLLQCRLRRCRRSHGSVGWSSIRPCDR